MDHDDICLQKWSYLYFLSVACEGNERRTGDCMRP